LGFLSLVSILLAKWFRDMDSGFLCLEAWGPHSFFQAHALWHTFCALAVLFCYLFLRSEVFNIYLYSFKDQEIEEDRISREENGRSSLDNEIAVVGIEMI